jgi:hypothetical protein
MQGHSPVLAFILKQQNILVAPVFEDGREWAGEMFLWPSLLNAGMEV